MKKAYESPKFVARGDIRTLTQGFNWTLNDDTIYGHSVPVGGPDGS